jgi:hypothetical protein
MTTDVEIANVALTTVKRKRIVSLTDGSPSGNDVNALFAPTRRKLLRGHDWNFARERVKLTRTSDTPVSEYDYEYALPSDFLAARKVSFSDGGQAESSYKIEGLRILADAEDVYLVYTKEVTNAAQFSDDFAWFFSMDLAYNLAKNSTRRQEAGRKRKSAQSKARSVDAMEDGPPRRPRGSWVTQRWRSGGSRWQV